MKCENHRPARQEIINKSHDELVVLSGLYAKMWVAQQAEELSNWKKKSNLALYNYALCMYVS